MRMVLDFEKPIADLETKLLDLRRLAREGDLNILNEITRLEQKTKRLLQTTYSKLSSWQKVLVARHPERPHTSAYIERLIEDFIPLAGDRNFAEDAAIIGGLGRFRGLPVMVLGHEKGQDTESRLHHNFGMPRPEGYRKVIRLMEIAHQFNRPLITFVDTAGAHPGIEAEERGQSEAIASCLETSFKLEVPFVSTIIGEGGSGGAVALATANTILMLEYSVYSVISPEGCASILWRTKDSREEAALSLKMTASNLLDLKVIDKVIPEPLGAAHRNRTATIDSVGDQLEKSLSVLLERSPKSLREDRRLKFLHMGRFKK